VQFHRVDGSNPGRSTTRAALRPERVNKRVRSLADWEKLAASLGASIAELVRSDADPAIQTPENDLLVLRLAQSIRSLLTSAVKDFDQLRERRRFLELQPVSSRPVPARLRPEENLRANLERAIVDQSARRNPDESRVAERDSARSTRSVGRTRSEIRWNAATCDEFFPASHRNLSLATMSRYSRRPALLAAQRTVALVELRERPVDAEADRTAQARAGQRRLHGASHRMSVPAASSAPNAGTTSLEQRAAAEKRDHRALEKRFDSDAQDEPPGGVRDEQLLGDKLGRRQRDGVDIRQPREDRDGIERPHAELCLRRGHEERDHGVDPGECQRELQVGRIPLLRHRGLAITAGQ
jgi:ribosomal protein L32